MCCHSSLCYPYHFVFTHIVMSLYFRHMFSVMRTILREMFRLRKLRHWRSGHSIQEKVPLYLEVKNVLILVNYGCMHISFLFWILLMSEFVSWQAVLYQLAVWHSESPGGRGWGISGRNSFLLLDFCFCWQWVWFPIRTCYSVL